MTAISLYPGDDYFGKCPQKVVEIGVKRCRVKIKTDAEIKAEAAVADRVRGAQPGDKAQSAGYNHLHPRVKYGADAWDRDLPYWEIPNCLRICGRCDEDRATNLLKLLREGIGDDSEGIREHQVEAAFLVHVFGVEANKNNLTYLTGVMALDLIVGDKSNFDEILSNYDKCSALHGCGGLLSMASWVPEKREEGIGNATLGLLGQILHRDVSMNAEIECMKGIFKQSQSVSVPEDWIIPMKEMLLLVRWCQFKLPDHVTISLEEGRGKICDLFVKLVKDSYEIDVRVRGSPC
jgi:hypothetical protein